jgi:hypothetical protein
MLLLMLLLLMLLLLLLLWLAHNINIPLDAFAQQL